MVVLTAYGVFHPEKIDTGLEACSVVRDHSIKEQGCERYDYFQSPTDPTRFVFVEEWTSHADLEAHFQTASFKDFMATLEPCLQAPPDIRIFQSELI